MATIPNITSPGENAGGGDFTANFLEKFSGETAASYKNNLVLMHRVRKYTLKGGKSHVFGAVGNATAKHHVRGTHTDEGTNVGEIEFGERKIDLDRPIFSVAFVDEMEEFMNSYEVRGPVVDSLGSAVADLAESQLMALLAIGGDSTSGAVADQPGGNDMVYLNADTNGADYVEAIKQQVLYWNINKVPMPGRFAVVPPTQYQMLAEMTDFHNVDINNGGNGSMKEGTIGRMHGVDILMSTLVPSTDISADPDPNYATNGKVNDYRVNAANCIGVFGTPRSLGVVKMKGFQIETEYVRKDKGTWFDASKVVGMNILRESDCGVLRTVAI